METEEVVELPKDTKFGMNDDIKDTASITNYSKVLSSLGYLRPANEIAKTKLEGSIPDPNINLYSLYPDLEDKLINQNWSLYVRPDKVTPDEWFDTLLHFSPLNNKIYVYYNTKESAFRSLYCSLSPALKIISLNAPFTRLRLSGLIFLLLTLYHSRLLYSSLHSEGQDVSPTRHSPLGCYESEHLRLSHHHYVHKL